MNGRIDFYTKVHKGLRSGLFQLSQHAATTDFDDLAAVAALSDEMRRLFDRFSSHARHEARFIHPLLERKTGTSPFETEHDALEAEQARLKETLAALAQPRSESRQDGLALYRALNAFIARYLEHLDREEATMPVLWSCCSDEELGAVMAAFGRSRPLAETLSDFRWMLPALSAPEQAELLGGLAQRAVAPTDACAANASTAATR